MKTRESGMPEEELWSSFFDPPGTLRKLGLRPEHSSVVDFGCGYGTFSIAAARIIGGTVHAFDLDPEMVGATRRKAQQQCLSNVDVRQRDFVELGTGLAAHSADYALMLNILHAEQPEILLNEARRILKPAGLLGVMHWNYDSATPRGPSMAIRLRPEQCLELVTQAGFEIVGGAPIDLPPYHYGFVARACSEAAPRH